jgi:hypothetical protein
VTFLLQFLGGGHPTQQAGGAIFVQGGNQAEGVLVVHDLTFDTNTAAYLVRG